MPERVLPLRELNRTTLLRQLLLRRARLGVLPAVERLAGLQAQEPRSPYVALWSRLEGFRRSQLEHALHAHAIVKATLMRVTLHLVSARDHRFFTAALRESRDALWERRRDRPLPAQAVIDRVLAFAEERPRKRSELFAFFERELGDTGQPWVDLAYFQGLGQLVQAPECALWSFRGAVSYRPLRVDLPEAEAGLDHLVRRYLAAFGPASRADLAQWSGLPLAQLDHALERLTLRRCRDESGRLLVDLPRAGVAGGDVPAPVRFLPKWDELLVAYQRRERVLPEDYRARVIGRNGDIAQSFLLDGFVAGTWRVENGRVVTEPFSPLPRAARSELADEARRLEAFLR